MDSLADGQTDKTNRLTPCAAYCAGNYGALNI